MLDYRDGKNKDHSKSIFRGRFAVIAIVLIMLGMVIVSNIVYAPGVAGALAELHNTSGEGQEPGETTPEVNEPVGEPVQKDVSDDNGVSDRDVVPGEDKVSIDGKVEGEDKASDGGKPEGEDEASGIGKPEGEDEASDAGNGESQDGTNTQSRERGEKEPEKTPEVLEGPQRDTKVKVDLDLERTTTDTINGSIRIEYVIFGTLTLSLCIVLVAPRRSVPGPKPVLDEETKRIINEVIYMLDSANYDESLKVGYSLGKLMELRKKKGFDPENLKEDHENNQSPDQ